MQEVNESFSYTTLFLLKLNLLFGDKREISLIEALEGRRVLEWNIREEGICFEEIDEQEEFMKFLEECSDLVYYKNGNIILNEDITVHNIDEAIAEIKPERYLDYNISIFKYLGITKPIDFINKYYGFERTIETLYMNNTNGIHNNALDSLFKERDEMLGDIKQLDEDYQDMITSLQDEFYDNLEDDYILFPINATRYEKSDHFDENTDIINLLTSPSQCTIFTDYPLFRTKVKFDFYNIIDSLAEDEINDVSDYEFDATEDYYDSNVDSSILNEDEYEEYDDINYNITNISDEFEDGLGVSVNLSRKDTIFVLEYIRILENMKDRYENVSDDINNLINRLKYIIDNDSIKLYKKNLEELDCIIEEYKKLDDLDYLRIADEVMYFINEIFNTYYDRFFLRKILFIKAYYNLTNDSEIINYINEYKSSRLYNHVYKIVTGEEPSKRKVK